MRCQGMFGRGCWTFSARSTRLRMRWLAQLREKVVSCSHDIPRWIGMALTVLYFLWSSISKAKVGGVQDIVIFVILNCNYIAYIYNIDICLYIFYFKHVIPMWYYICYIDIRRFLPDFMDLPSYLCSLASLGRSVSLSRWMRWRMRPAAGGVPWRQPCEALTTGWSFFSVVNIANYGRWMPGRLMEHFENVPFVFSKMRIWAMNCSFEIHEISPGKNDFMGIFFHSPEDTRHRRQLFLVAG